MKMRLSSDEWDETIFDRQLPEGFVSKRGVDERQFCFDHRLGKMDVQERWFEGVHLSFGHWQVNSSQGFKAESDTPIIEMHFSLTGNNVAQIHNSSHHFQVGTNQHNIYFMPGFEGTFSVKNSPGVSRFFEIHFTEAYFRRFADSGNKIMEDFQNAIDKRRMSMMGRHNQTITPAMHHLLNELIAPGQQDILYRLYIESKVLELLMLQIAQFDQASGQLPEAPLSRQDLDKVHHARHLLHQDIRNPGSLLSLARSVGLNDFKLKKGFKQVFQQTVFGYLHELRMQEARRMLLEKSELWAVAEYCGYQHVSHFSTAFRKKFGVSPGQFRNRAIAR